MLYIYFIYIYVCVPPYTPISSQNNVVKYIKYPVNSHSYSIPREILELIPFPSHDDNNYSNPTIHSYNPQPQAPQQII